MSEMAQPPQQFHRFGELPYEIKIQIFTEAIGSCTYAGDLSSHTFHTLEPFSLGQSIPILISPYYKKIVYGHRYLLAEFTELSTFMSTCRLSRIVLLELWLQRVEEGRKGYDRKKREVRMMVEEVLGELLKHMKDG